MTLNTEPLRNTMASLASVGPHGISRPRRLSILKQPQSQTHQESPLMTHTKASSSKPLAVPNVTTLLRRTLAAGTKAKPSTGASGGSLALKSTPDDERTGYQTHHLRCVSPRNLLNRKLSYVTDNAGGNNDGVEGAGHCRIEEPIPVGHKQVVVVQHRTTPVNKSGNGISDSAKHTVGQDARKEKSRRATLLSHGARERPSQLPRLGTLAGRGTFMADQHYSKSTPNKAKMPSRIPCYPADLRTTLNKSCASSRECNTDPYAAETKLTAQAKAESTSEHSNLNVKSINGSNALCGTRRSIEGKDNIRLLNAAPETELKHLQEPMMPELEASMLARLLHQETVADTSVTQQRQSYEQRNLATARTRNIHNSESQQVPWSVRGAGFSNPATEKESQDIMINQFSRRSQKEASQSDNGPLQSHTTAPVYWGETYNISDSETAETLPSDYQHPPLQTAQLENIWEPEVTKVYNATGYQNSESLHRSPQTHRLVEKQRNGHLLQFVNPYRDSHLHSSLETFAPAFTAHDPLDEEQRIPHRDYETCIRASALHTSRGVDERRSRECTPWLGGNRQVSNMETRTRMQWTSRSVSQAFTEQFRGLPQHSLDTRENREDYGENYSSRKNPMFHPPDDKRELPKPFSTGYAPPYTQGLMDHGILTNLTRDKEVTDLWSAVEYGVGKSVQLEGPAQSVKNRMGQCGLDRKRFSMVADPKQRAALSQSVLIKSSRVDSSCCNSNSDVNLSVGWNGLLQGSQSSCNHKDGSPRTAIPREKRNDSYCFSQANSARGMPPTIFGVTSQSKRHDAVQVSAVHDAYSSESGPYPASSSASVVSLYPAPAPAQEPIHADLLPRDRQTGFEQCRESLKVVLQKMEDLPRLLFDCDVYNFYLQFIHFPTRENPIEPITTDPIGPFFSKGSSNGLTVCCDMMNSVVEIPYVAKTELRIAVLQEYRDQKDFVGRARVILPGLPRHAADAGIVTLLDAPSGIPIEGAAGCIRGKISLTVLCRVNLAVPSHSAQKHSSGGASQAKERLLPPGDRQRLDAYSNQMCGQAESMWASGGPAPTSALWSFLESMFSDPLAAAHESYEQERMEAPMSEHLQRMRRRSLRQGRTERRPFSVFCMDIPDQLCGG